MMSEFQKIIAPWLLAIRPKTLPAAIAPVIVGATMAFGDYKFRLTPLLGCLVVAILLQIGSNLANDVYDFEKGADGGVRYGPTRVTQAGLLTPQDVKRGMWMIFLLTGIIGIYLVYIGGWVIFVLGIAAIVAAIAYTGGPFPLGYHGLGDLFVFIFFGLVATAGTYFLQTGVIRNEVWWMGAAMGSLTVNILVVNNLRDIESDRKVNKLTIAVRLGKNGAIIQYVTLLLIAHLIPIYIYLTQEGGAWGLLTLLSLPLGLRWVIYIVNNKGVALNLALAGTGQVELIYAILYGFGEILSRINV